MSNAFDPSGEIGVLPKASPDLPVAQSLIPQGQNPTLDWSQTLPRPLAGLSRNLGPADDPLDVVLAPLEAAGNLGCGLSAGLERQHPTLDGS